MSIVQMMGAAAIVGAGGAAVVTLSGETVNAFAFMNDARAELELRTNGNMYREVNNGGATQIDSGSDWIRPVSASPSLYETRYTNRTGDLLHAGTSSGEDGWRDVSVGTYFWVQQDSTPTAGGEDSTFDIQVRFDGGSVLASTSYRLIADREDF